MRTFSLLGYCLLSIFSLRVASQEVRPSTSQKIYANDPDRVQLTRCGNDIILPEASNFARIGLDGLPVSGGIRCDVTPLFEDFCDARVKCRFSQAEFRRRAAATGSKCSTAAYTIVFAYRCLTVSSINSVHNLQYDLPANTINYLRSPNYPNQPENRMHVNDEITMCVLTMSDGAVTVSEFRANVFGDTEDVTSGQLDIQGVAESGEKLPYRLTSTSGSVNYTDVLGVKLESLHFTYSQGEENLSFLMRLQVTATARICCQTMSNDQYRKSCGQNITASTDDASIESEESDSNKTAFAMHLPIRTPIIIIGLIVVVASLTLVVIVIVIVSWQKQSISKGKPPSYANVPLQYDISPPYENTVVQVHGAESPPAVTDHGYAQYSTIDDIDVTYDNTTYHNVTGNALPRNSGYETIDDARLRQAYASLCPETSNDYEGPYSALRT